LNKIETFYLHGSHAALKQARRAKRSGSLRFMSEAASANPLKRLENC
jgi:hypothetical protein